MSRIMLHLCGIVSVALAMAAGSDAVAGGFSKAFHCKSCGCGAGGSPYGNTGCGPRYWGAVPEEGWCPDPCDRCARWRGCHGAGPGLDMLAPWQLPPGRGFMNAEQMGYDTRHGCDRCQR
ncbi:MAG: hypothetical protein ACKOYJ_00230 [Planctomycetia bacterium]